MPSMEKIGTSPLLEMKWEDTGQEIPCALRKGASERAWYNTASPASKYFWQTNIQLSIPNDFPAFCRSISYLAFQMSSSCFMATFRTKRVENVELFPKRSQPFYRNYRCDS